MVDVPIQTPFLAMLEFLRMTTPTTAAARERLATGYALDRLWSETRGLPDGDSKERPLRLIAQLLEREGVPYALAGTDSRGSDAAPDCWSRRQRLQRMSLIGAHPLQPDGIWSAARHDAGQRSVAIFDRAASEPTVTTVSGLMGSPQDIATAPALEKYGFTLLP